LSTLLPKEVRAVSSKADYTPEEWSALVRAPLLAGLSLSIADPGGPIEAAREAIAMMKVMTSPDSQAELLVAVSGEAKEMMNRRENPIGDFKPDPARAGEQILDELRGVARILRTKATADEAAAFRDWLVRTAQAAADAAKEGGFLRFGAVKVSDGEQRMLDQVAAALGGVAADPAAAVAGASSDTAAGEGEEERDQAPAGVPRVDLELCTGCGICVDVCPEVFEIGDDGFSQVIHEYGCDDAGCCEEAAEQCPEGAISIEPLQHA